MYETKDSGKREEFSTGSRRDTREGKGRFDLISPIAMRRLAGVYERGAKKYGDHNWAKGQPLSRYIDSALRHINHVLLGDEDEDHAAQAMWNMASFIHTQEMIRAGRLPLELDDMPGDDNIDYIYEDDYEDEPVNQKGPNRIPNWALRGNATLTVSDLFKNLTGNPEIDMSRVSEDMLDTPFGEIHSD